VGGVVAVETGSDDDLSILEDEPVEPVGCLREPSEDLVIAAVGEPLNGLLAFPGGQKRCGCLEGFCVGCAVLLDGLCHGHGSDMVVSRENWV